MDQHQGGQRETGGFAGEPGHPYRWARRRRSRRTANAVARSAIAAQSTGGRRTAKRRRTAAAEATYRAISATPSVRSEARAIFASTVTLARPRTAAECRHRRGTRRRCIQLLAAPAAPAANTSPRTAAGSRRSCQPIVSPIIATIAAEPHSTPRTTAELRASPRSTKRTGSSSGSSGMGTRKDAGARSAMACSASAPACQSAARTTTLTRRSPARAPRGRSRAGQRRSPSTSACAVLRAPSRARRRSRPPAVAAPPADGLPARRRLGPCAARAAATRDLPRSHAHGSWVRNRSLRNEA